MVREKPEAHMTALTGTKRRATSRDMTREEPSARDIQELVAYLPKLYGEGAPRPVVRWMWPEKEADGTVTMPHPLYDDTVRSFIDLIVDQGCWIDFDYKPESSRDLLMDEEAVRNATIPQIRQMLTYIVRGERFCDGFWGGMVEEGHVRRVLERLSEIGRES